MKIPKIGVYFIKNGKPVKKYTEGVRKDVLLIVGQYCQFYLNVKPLGLADFNTAQKKAAEIGKGWGCPDKYQGLTIIDHKTEIRKKIKALGSSLYFNYCFWTCKESTRKSDAALFWDISLEICWDTEKNYSSCEVLAVSDFHSQFFDLGYETK